MKLTKRTRKAIMSLLGKFGENRGAVKKLLSDWDRYFEREGIDRHHQAPKFFNIMGERARSGIVSLSPPVPSTEKELLKRKIEKWDKIKLPRRSS